MFATPRFFVKQQPNQNTNIMKTIKTTVIHHSADFDGLFCREIARKFLPDAELIGWDFGDAPLEIPSGPIYVMDLPIDRIFGFDYSKVGNKRGPQHPPGLVWIDHHKSSIETHPKDIPGYRIDGVAACRLAWQWFQSLDHVVKSGYHSPLHTLDSDRKAGGLLLPKKQDYIDRKVEEPLAVRLAGEYDIHDSRMKTEPDIELFQHGLRSEDVNFERLLNTITIEDAADYVEELLKNAKILSFARANEYRDVITQQGFDVEFEGVKFLACNSHECDIRSQLFEAGIKPHHEALLGFTFTGHDWRISMYRIDGKETDILSIAKKYGGGGHPGANGFRSSDMASILGSSHF